jgi:hypothetical protein
MSRPHIDVCIARLKKASTAVSAYEIQLTNASAALAEAREAMHAAAQQTADFVHRLHDDLAVDDMYTSTTLQELVQMSSRLVQRQGVMRSLREAIQAEIATLRAKALGRA